MDDAKTTRVAWESSVEEPTRPRSKADQILFPLQLIKDVVPRIETTIFPAIPYSNTVVSGTAEGSRFEAIDKQLNTEQAQDQCATQGFASYETKRMTFRTELQQLLNRHCKENDSNTPDFILADYLIGCLSSFDKAIKLRENWYGRKTF